MYAVKYGHIEVVKLLLAQPLLDILAINGVSIDSWFKIITRDTYTQCRASRSEFLRLSVGLYVH